MYFLMILEPEIFNKKSFNNLEYFMNLPIDDISKYHTQLLVMKFIKDCVNIPLDFSLLKNKFRLTRRIKILEILKSELFAIVDEQGRNKTEEYLRKKLSTEFAENKKNDPKFRYRYILNIINNKYYNKYNIFEGGVGETLTPTKSFNNNEPQSKMGDLSQVEDIFNYWVDVMGKVKSRTVLTDSRKRKILSALKNYSADDLKSAIHGCSLSPFHMGVNEQGKRFDSLSLIIRDADRIEKFIEFSINPPVSQNKKPSYETVEEHNTRVIDEVMQDFNNSTAIEGNCHEGRGNADIF